MKSLAMERVIFGDNQFFGINHMSEEKAREQTIRFADDDSIIRVLRAAHDEGIRAFMCTTHDRMAGISDRVRKGRDLGSEFVYYPCMPYAHKYANAITEFGPVEAIRRFIPQDGLLRTAWKSGVSLVKKDVEGVLQVLVDMEMSMFAGLNTPIIFLQNVVTDLLLGLGLAEGLAIFARHVRSRYGAEPGFITMNLALLVRTLEEAGVKDAVLCANVNKIGFRMSGGMADYEQILRTPRHRTVAMSVFASGAIRPEEALQYVCNLPGVHSIVFGASSRDHIRQTKRLIDHYDEARLSKVS